MTRALPRDDLQLLPSELDLASFSVPRKIAPQIQKLIETYWEFVEDENSLEFEQWLNHILDSVPKKIKKFNNSNLGCEQLWQQVIEHLTSYSIKVLCVQHGQLISLQSNVAQIGITSRGLFNLFEEKREHLSQAFELALGREIKVNFQVINSQEFIEVSPLESQEEAVIVSGLTVSQSQAMEAIINFLKSGERYFRLTGYAGTGKSYLIGNLIEYLQQENQKFEVATPTNKAAKNLTKLAEERGLSVQVKTIARLLAQQPELDEDTGEELFVSQQEVDLSEYDVIIFDEFSMINSDNFQEIHQAVRLSPRTKIIYVGDGAQLPPVGESMPIVLGSNLITASFTLREIVRYEGEISKVAEKIRSIDKYNYQLYPYQSTADKSLVVCPYQQWLETAVTYFQSSNYREDSDYCRILVWRNRTADALNAHVRKNLWGEGVPPYVTGERLIAKRPVFRTFAQKKSYKKWSIVINNSEECEVIDSPRLLTSKKKKENKYDYWEILVMTESKSKVKLKILTDESEKIRQEKLQELKDKKQWREYTNLNKSYDYMAYAYALTTHKAQGSSLDYIFVDVNDFRGCSDLQKMQYTALTRAKKCAYIPRGKAAQIADS
jgi:hypothetical protein